MLKHPLSWPRAHPRGWDSLVAGVLTVVIGVPSVMITLVSLPGSRWIVVLAGVVICHGSMLLARTRPSACLAAVSVGVMIMMVGTEFFVFLPSVLIFPMAIYTLAGYGSPRAAHVGLTVGLLGSAVPADRALADPLPGLPMPAPVFLSALAAALVTLAWVGGLFLRTRRAQLDLLADRVRYAELEQHRLAMEARLAERTRIAREFHDIVAHSLAVIVNVAKGARYAASSDPAQVEPALTAIEDTSRGALGELRGLVQVLQDPDVPYQPTPGLSDVSTLVETTAKAGLPVELEQGGDPRPVGNAVGLATYRLVQESLTNVIKHAGPATKTRVRLDWLPGRMRVEVHNEAPHAETDHDVPGQLSFGVGLSGVAGRVAAASGQCQYGTDPDGGYLVRAEFPDQLEAAPS